MKKIIFGFLLFQSSSIIAAVINEQLSLGAFVDSYYAYDFNQPSDFERQYTTQPVRSNEFNLNLAFIDLSYKTQKIRSRFALQTGQSVTKNTAGEPVIGATSGPKDAKALQESYVGVKVGEKTWLDMGIYLGNIGMESWISKDNYTYTRSMQLDYVPYYSSGLRLDHEIDSTQKIQLHLMNGWQNMSENNNSKAFGFQYWKKMSESVQLTYNNFFGDEEVVSSKPRFRGYHDFIFKFQVSDKWIFMTSFDIGHQSCQSQCGLVPWYATSTVIRYALSATESLSFRAEYYNDRHQANVVTNTENGFQVVSTSVNYDKNIDTTVLWRTEVRGFNSKDKIYPRSDSFSYNDLFIVSSLAISI